MNKRKLMLVAVALCMVAILGFGGTLAYLTDEESARNVFTVGNVDIKLVEKYTPNSKLLPGIDVQKEVRVTNTGSEDAYVRVLIAIPKLLNSGLDDDPQNAAYDNTLHFNMSAESVADGLWNWNSDAEGSNYPGNGGNWNMTSTKVTNDKGIEVEYDVYIVTYETALKPEGQEGATTAQPAMYNVFLDTKLDNEDIKYITDTLGDIDILVAAEAVQAAGFENAYDAFENAKDDLLPDVFNPGLTYDAEDEQFDNESYTAPIVTD